MQRLAAWVGSTSSLIAIVVACGGGSTGSSSGGGVARSEASYCTEREARSKSCASDAGREPTFNRAGCTEDYDCASALLLSPDGYFACRTNADCAASTNDDTCILQSSPGRSVPQADACAKKYAECRAGDGEDFDDDVCPALNAMSDAALEKVSACIDKPCDQIDDCIEATVAAISPACD